MNEPGSPVWKALWEGPLAECPLAFVDLEMTGLDATKDRVVEVCIQRVARGVVEKEIDSIVCPDGDWAGSPGMKIHGIAQSDIAGARPFAEIADEICALLEGAAFVAHAAEWDVKFLAAELARMGRTFAPECVIDTLRLSRRAFALPSHSLEALAKHWGHAHVAHRAHADVLATRTVYAKCVEALAPKSARDLASVHVGDRVAREEIIKSCEAALGAEAAVRILYRPSGGPRVELVVRVTAVERAALPVRVVVYEVSSRARRELRADRILVCAPFEPS